MKLSLEEMTWFGLALLSLILGGYQYLTHEPISAATSLEIEGNLRDKPVKHTQGGDMPYHYVTFQVDNRNETFRLKNCSYQLTDIERLLDLDKGALMNIIVDKKELRTEDKVPVYSLSAGDMQLGFALAQFNRCYVDYWKRIVPLGIVFLAAGIIGVVSRIRRMNKTNANKG